MKKIFTFILTIAMCLPMLAQTESTEKTADIGYDPNKYQFVSVQGGITNTFNNFYDTGRQLYKYWTPTMSLSYGGFWNRRLGARLHLNGIWKESGIANGNSESISYKYNYLTTNADLLINLTNINTDNLISPVNVLLAVGLGANYAWETADEAENAAATPGTRFMYADNDSRWAMNTRLGVIFDVPINKHFSVNLETDLNYIETFTKECFNSDNLQFTAQLGVNYRFAYKKILPPTVEPVYATRMDTTWYDDTEYKDMTEDGSMTWNVYYKIRESDWNEQIDNNADAQLAAIGKFLADHKACKVNMKSYADVETGNPRINMEYSKERSEKAASALVAAGVSKDIITAEYFGDTVQPFAENDKNRCTIITATGLKDYKKPYTVKKFRVQEVQYRVN